MRAAVFFSALFLATCAVGPVSGADRPHIILIMADDIGVEGLSCYGGESYQTPRLDEMAAAGMRFTHAYAQPLCTPTRVELMTGRENNRNWLYFGCLEPSAKTFGHYFQDGGYRTCIAGKWQLRSYDPPDYPGAMQRRNRGMHPRDAGFDDWSLFHAEHTEDKGSRYGDPTIMENGKILENTEGKFGEDISVEFISSFLEKNSDEPCFVYYPMALPHWPFVPTPDTAEFADPEKRLVEDVKYFPDMVAYMDKVVGRLVDRVAELGLADDTLILFYGDNGTDRRVTSIQNGVEVPGGKGFPAQNGIHVPLIAFWPGKVPVGTCDDIVEASDFVPTLCEIAGIETREDWKLDGVSFAPAIFGKENPQARDWAFFWYDPRPGWDKDQFDRWVFAVDKNYKLYSDGNFYDINKDPLDQKPLRFWDEGEKGLESLNRLRSAIEKMMQ